jgi:hypothetical protein
MQPSRSRRFVPKHLLHGAALVLAACWLGGCASHDASERDASTGGATSDAPPAKHPIGTGGGGNGENGENGGSGGGKTTPEETPCDQNPVCKSLNALGVGTDETPRLDANGDPLPDTFNPLGSQRHALNPVSELFVGFRFASESSVFELHDDEDETRTNPLVRTYTDDLTAMLSTVVAADLDGDGAQEIAGLWFDEGELVLRPPA